MKMLWDRMSGICKKLFYSPGVNPLPWKTMTSLFFLMMMTMGMYAMTLAFLPALVKSFGTSEVNTGYYVAILTAVIPLSRTFSSLLWGYASDKYSKKNVYLFSTVISVLICFLFGFANNFAYAVVVRILQGFLMGTVVIGKAYISEFTDDTNAALAMSIFLSAYTFGLLVGPSIGGFLAFPADLYPDTFSSDSFFGEFPVFLPCAFVVVLYSLFTVLAYFWMQDTSKSRNISDDSNNETNSNEETYLLNDKNDKRTISQYNTGTYLKEKLKPIIELLRKKNLLIVSFLYLIYAVLSLGFDECYPLYAATVKKYHGYGFTAKEIGISLMSLGFITLILQWTVLPRLIGVFGNRKTFAICCFIQALLCPILPALEMLHNRYALWTFVIALLCVIRSIASLGFTCINLLINNSVEKHLIGSANGFALALASIGRTIGGAMIGSLFSWSLTNIKDVDENKSPLGFPLNQYFIFFILSIFALISAIVALRLPSSLDKRQ